MKFEFCMIFTCHTKYYSSFDLCSLKNGWNHSWLTGEAKTNSRPAVARWLQSADPCARGENLPLLKNSQSPWSCALQPLLIWGTCPGPVAQHQQCDHTDGTVYCPLGSDPLQANIQCPFKGTRGTSLGSPLVRIWSFHCCGLGSIPGWGTKIPQAILYSKKQTKCQ